MLVVNPFYRTLFSMASLIVTVEGAGLAFVLSPTATDPGRRFTAADAAKVMFGKVPDEDDAADDPEDPTRQRALGREVDVVLVVARVGRVDRGRDRAVRLPLLDQCHQPREPLAVRALDARAQFVVEPQAAPDLVPERAGLCPPRSSERFPLRAHSKFLSH